MRRRSMLLVWTFTLALGGLLAPSGAAAESGDATPIFADLEGKPIAATDVGRYFCHDFDFPRIRCFSTSTALEDQLRSGAALGGSMAVAAYSAGDYLTVYSEPSYGGAYAHLSQNYDALWGIGWNDRIRSFKVRNSASGSFYTDWYASGRRYAFCCNSAMPSLSSTYDRAFSSVYRG